MFLAMGDNVAVQVQVGGEGNSDFLQKCGDIHVFC